jgi:hypothetical protein
MTGAAPTASRGHSVAAARPVNRNLRETNERREQLDTLAVLYGRRRFTGVASLVLYRRNHSHRRRRCPRSPYRPRRK